MPEHCRKSYPDRQLRRIASVSCNVHPRLPVRSGIAASVGLPPNIGWAIGKLQPDYVIRTNDIPIGRFVVLQGICSQYSDSAILLILLKFRRRYNRYK
jgi:hypothetical protein